MTPTRVQRSRAKGAKLPAGTLCCTRPGKWCNPFRVVRHEAKHWQVHITIAKGDTPEKVERMMKILTRASAGYIYETAAIRYAIESFRILIKAMPDTYQIEELRKYKHLACWCPLDAPCHVDVLIEKLKQ